jgi:predicted Zn finger-like uncharacterized protein
MTSSREARALRQSSWVEPTAQRMKFLCPNCKTKYQIAEEKVAGRSVKIECRNCGFLIRIAQPPQGAPAAPAGGLGLPRPGRISGDAPAGVSGRAPPAASPVRDGAIRSLAPRRAPLVHLSGQPLPPPRAHSRRPVSDAQQGGASIRPLPRPRRADPSRAAPKTPPVEAAPRSRTQSGPRTAVPRPARQMERGVSAAPDEPTPVKRVSSEQLVSRASATGPEQPAAGALAGAFAKAVDRTPSTGPPSLAAGHEWWVGINDTPNGPLKLSELRVKAALGVVGPSSLVWREGFEDWAPVNKFPELLAIVEEASPAPRLSRPSPLPGSDLLRRIRAPAALSDPFVAAARSADAPAPAEPGQAPEAGSAAGSPQAATGAARSLDAAEPVSPAGSTVEARASGAAQSDAAPGLGGLSGLSGPAAAARVGQAASLSLPHWEAEHIPGLTRGRPIPAAAWVAVAAAILFGLALGFVMFGGSGAETVAQAPEAQARPSDPKPRAASKSIPEPDAEEEESEEEEPVAAANGSRARRARRKSATRSSSSGAKARSGSGLTGLQGLSAVKGGGPKATSKAAESSSGRSQGLDSDTLTRTVSRYKSSVSRSCWQPALDTRDRNAPSSARVSATIEVASSGKVRSVRTSGDPNGYRGLARCIESRVRGWRFPASGGKTTVNVPFVFTAQ